MLWRAEWRSDLTFWPASMLTQSLAIKLLSIDNADQQNKSFKNTKHRIKPYIYTYQHEFIWFSDVLMIIWCYACLYDVTYDCQLLLTPNIA